MYLFVYVLLRGGSHGSMEVCRYVTLLWILVDLVDALLHVTTNSRSPNYTSERFRFLKTTESKG